MPFWSKKSTIISSELKLEWEHLFRTFPRWLIFRRENGLWELNERAKHKTEQTTWQGDDKLIIYSAGAFSTERKQSLVLNNFSALEASKWFQILYQSNRSFNMPPPGQPPGHLNFWKMFAQIPPSLGRKAVQMPPPLGKLPDYCFDFSVAFIMLLKLCM